MKDKIFQEVMKWYENQGESPDIEDFVVQVIDKTASVLLDDIRNQLKNEFASGNLQHPFIISSDYYIDLKLKEIKEKYNLLIDED